MKKIIILVMLMCSVCFGNARPRYSKSKDDTQGGFWANPADIPTPPADYTVIGSSASENNNNNNLVGWMALFDALPRTAKEDLGAATNPNAGLDVAVPHVIEYRYGNIDGEPMLLVAGLHGSETQTIACVYWMAWCINNSKTPYFQWMRANIDLRIIPCVNPQGTVMFQRRNNANNSGTDSDVDINRNFDWRWGSSGTISDQTYAGASAASELETQYLVERASTIVETVGTITGTITAGDIVTQTNTQATGVVISNTGTGATAILTIRVTSPQWVFETGDDASHPIFETENVNEQATPVVTVIRIRPKVFIDCHNTGSSDTQNINVLEPNFQLLHDWDITQTLKEMATPIIADAGTGQLGFPSMSSLNFSQAAGLSHNFGASLGIQSYIFEVDRDAWAGSISLVDKNLVRAYVGGLASAISLAGDAKLVARKQSVMLTGPSSQTLGASVYVYGPDGGDDKAWARSDYNHLATAYDDPGIIYLPAMSDVILTASGAARGSGGTPRVTQVMWLDDSTDTEVGSGSSQTYFFDLIDGKYLNFGGPMLVYHNLPAGFYDVRYSLQPSATNALVFRLHVRVDIIPALKREVHYNILAP